MRQNVKCPLQARDTYYSGHPLVGDDIYDKVEVRTLLSPALMDHSGHF